MNWNSHDIEDRVLPLVARPGRYVGRELHISGKPHSRERVSVLLAFPDAYEIGMSHLGLKILYHLVNRREDALAEFVFCPWPDMEDRMRKSGIPLFSLQTRTPAGQFDILGVSLQHELQYTNALNLLDLAGIPLRTEARGEGVPLVIAGGPCCFNPEPMVPFFDAFAIGDGEDLIRELVEVVGECKRAGLPRAEALERVGGIPGMYVPGLGRGASPDPVTARVVRRLDRDNYPSHPPVPLMDIAHNRLGVEIMRGCTRGCRFCQAGMIGRPVREMPEDDVIHLAVEGVASGGWDEVALVSLSSSDYSSIESLVPRLGQALDSRRVGVCLPSLRPGGLTQGIAAGISRFRHPGLTLAPEAGTQRLRRVINKEFDEDLFLGAVRTARRHGWRQLKLYFMIGLPTEQEEDLLGMASLARRVTQVKADGRSLSVKMSVSPFVPKPHTPFQWEPQIAVDETTDKMRFLKRHLRGAPVQLRWPKGEMSTIEGLLARGDRRLAAVVEEVWRGGARFEGWTESFRYDRWQQALSGQGLDVETFLGTREVGGSLPWDTVSSGVTREFLLAERARAFRETSTPDCREGECGSCLRPDRVAACRRSTARMAPRAPASFDGPGPRRNRPSDGTGLRMGVRLRYAKGEPARFTSHLDVVRIFDRAVRRSEVPVVQSAGFSSRPKMAFGPPLSLGMTSAAEYVDLQVLRPWRMEDRTRLAGVFPPGFELLDAQGFYGKAGSLGGPGGRVRYRVRFGALVRAMESDLDSGLWWEGWRRRVEEVRGMLPDGCADEDEEAGAEEGKLKADAPTAARVLSLDAEPGGGGEWELRLELRTGAGLRNVWEETLVALVERADLLPLARMEREAYDLWDGGRWVAPMQALTPNRGRSTPKESRS